MSDPLSITIAAGTLLSCCYKITKFVYTVYADNKEIDQKAARFAKHVEGLANVLEDLKENFEDPASKDVRGGTGIQAGHWDHVETIIYDCHVSLQGMEKVIDGIEGETSGKKGFRAKAMKQARFYFKEEELTFRKKEVETYTATLSLSLQTVSLVYSETTIMRLDEMSRQLDNVHKMLRKMSTASQSGSVVDAAVDEKVDNLRQCAASARRIISSASTVIGGGSTTFGSEYGTQLTPKRRKEMEEWIGWPDSSTVTSDTLVHSVTGSSATAANRGAGPDNANLDHLETKAHVHDEHHHHAYESKSEASSTMEEGILGRLIALAKEKYGLEEYKEAEKCLEYALKQANTQDAGKDETEIQNEHARLREVLELLCLCYEKLKDWDRAEMILGKLEQMPGATESQTLEMGHIMAEMQLERGQLDQAVETIKKVVDGKRKLLKKANPSFQQSALLLVRIHEARGDGPLAEATFRKYLPEGCRQPVFDSEGQPKGKPDKATVAVVGKGGTRMPECDEVVVEAHDSQDLMSRDIKMPSGQERPNQQKVNPSNSPIPLANNVISTSEPVPLPDSKPRSQEKGFIQQHSSQRNNTRSPEVDTPVAVIPDKRETESPRLPKIRKTSADEEDTLTLKTSGARKGSTPILRSNSTSKHRENEAITEGRMKLRNDPVRSRSNSTLNGVPPPAYSAKGDAFRRKSEEIANLWVSDKVDEAAEEGTKYLLSLLSADLRKIIDPQAIADFLRKNADQGFASSEDKQQNPIHLLAMAGLRDHISVLLDKGVNIDALNEKHCTPLYLASKFGQAKVVELLLSRGASTTGRSKDRRTALHAACREGVTETAKLLLDRGFDIEAATTHGTTPLIFACRYGCTQTAKMLLSNKANINAKSKDGSTPASVACGFGHSKTAEMLIVQGANIRTRHGDDELTPFLLAASYGHADVVNLLLSKGVNIADCDKGRRTALHLAVMRNKIGVIQALVKKGADPYKKDAEGMTPMKIAKTDKNDKAIAILKTSQKKKSFMPFFS